MRRNTLLTLILIIISCSTFAAKYSTEIESQRGEKWWGIFVGGAPLEPFNEPFSIKTSGYNHSGFFTPLMVSSSGRYIWSPSPIEITFDGRNIKIGSDDSPVEVRKGGRNLREAYLVACHKHFPPSGKTPAMELFTTPIYDTRTEMGYSQSQSQILTYADRLLNEGFPAGIILIADGWNSPVSTFDFEREYYPDPKAMVEQLHQKGFKVMLEVTPYASTGGRAYLQNIAQNLLLKNDIGTPLILDSDAGLYSCYDLSQTATTTLIKNALIKLKSEYSIDGFRFDSRAVMPLLTKDANLMQKFMANWVALCETSHMCEYLPGLNTPLTPYINCIESSNKADWGVLQHKISDIMTAGLCGFSYCHIFSSLTSSNPILNDQQFILRTIQLSSFMPITSISIAPWRISDPKLLAAAKEALNLRISLSSYISELVNEAARTAEPLVRNMEYMYPNNGFADCNDQFMLGSKYLCAPILEDQTSRLVRLPRGVWIDKHGKRFKGPLVTSVDVSNGDMIYFELAAK